MAKLFNRARMITTTVGTGTITLGPAFSNAFLTFAEAGVANGDVVAYCIEDGTDFESGVGTYTSAGTTLSRTTVRVSKIAGVAGTTKLTLSGNAMVFLSPAKEDLLSVTENQTTNFVHAGPASGGAAPPAFRALVNADIPNMARTTQYLLSGTGATYTTPANCRLIIVRMIAGGGGGGAATTNNGAAGGTSTFNSVNATGGGGGATAGTGSIGGSGGTGTATYRMKGAPGGAGTGANNFNSGFGGGGLMGHGGGEQVFNAAGVAAPANSGAGGSGGGGGATNPSGSGGGGGEYVEIVIPSPAGTYIYTIGAGGNGGAAGVRAGGNGGSGVIIVEEYY